MTELSRLDRAYLACGRALISFGMAFCFAVGVGLVAFMVTLLSPLIGFISLVMLAYSHYQVLRHRAEGLELPYLLKDEREQALHMLGLAAFGGVILTLVVLL